MTRPVIRLIVYAMTAVGLAVGDDSIIVWGLATAAFFAVLDLAEGKR